MGRNAGRKPGALVVQSMPGRGQGMVDGGSLSTRDRRQGRSPNPEGRSNDHSPRADERTQPKRRKPVKRVCASCGDPFYGASHARYCSNACKQKAHRKRKKQGNKKDASGNRICAHCGTAFTGALYGRYCSNACKQKEHRERKKALRSVTIKA